MKMNFIIISDEFEDSDMETAGEGHSVLLDANGVIFDVLTPIQEKNDGLPAFFFPLRG